MTAEQDTTAGLSGARHPLWKTARVLRSAASGTIGGLIAGVVVGGVGSRLAMRISGAMTDGCVPGLVTENGNRCGEITLGGTVGLLLFAGAFTGIVGGLVYVVVRPWLRELGRWRSLAYAAMILAAGGFIVLDAENVDFHRFGSPVVNVLMFASLFVLYGLAVAPLADRIERGLPRFPPDRPIRPRTVAGWVLVVAGAVPLLPAVGAIAGGGIITLAIFLLAIAPALGARLRDRGRTTAGIALASLAVIPMAAGTFFTVRSVYRILG